MHQAALRAAGLEGSYRALETPPPLLQARLEEVRRAFAGVNVTIPHKESVLEYLDELSPEAAAIGAVNTIVCQQGRLIGYNTDALGFISGLEEAGIAYRNKKALVLGAGGAARAVAYALKQEGVHVAVYNRTTERARALCAAMGLHLVTEPLLETAVRSCDLLVNTTSVGLNDPTRSPLPPGLLPRAGVVVDIIYHPQTTRLLLEAQQAGLVTLGGLPMLVWQGARAFELWTGVKPDVRVMYAAAQAGLGHTPSA
ncbi:shikimate 5-dehydrogenase [Meiothermus taiwanensis WR-220]|jgi:shikimate dehydrogenase|uniref:Shikimate dehydrogenase (NADP(+)) n=3 Tax=Meiothermus taiwanensis TaxID=172827 RepID=A0A399DX10_9DEIN|nr:shikimate 5-dehydrogenase [Meiothermus taiwanensis WR-220]KZK16510.1 shikimate dehydrogenase [Meiothermus taiwanensis]RIH76526.1 Shikimate dehydrogenase (NADP(+)) [Meiothermus taiwanensis]